MNIAKPVVQLIGWMLLVIGIVGLFLPFLQGILFIFVGLIILSSQYEWAGKVLVKARTQFPQAAKQLEGFLQKMRKRFPAFSHQPRQDK
jgi:uncharacterized membrane protein YbaN (DUF454 family)